MSELKLSISSRKYVRKVVTEIFNKRDTFSTLSRTDQNTKKSFLKDFITQLRDYDSKIQFLNWAQKEDESVLGE